MEHCQPTRPREPRRDANIASETFLFPPRGLRYGLGLGVSVTAVNRVILPTINNNNQYQDDPVMNIKALGKTEMMLIHFLLLLLSEM